MIETPDDLFRHFQALGITVKIWEHEPVFTVEASRELHVKIPGAHTKNLFLWDRKTGYFLVSAREDTRVALNGLHKVLAAAGRLTFGSADEMWERLRVRPGAVTPFALVNASPSTVRFVLDPALAAAETVNFHPLVNTMTCSISASDFRRFLASVDQSAEPVKLSGD